MSTQTTFVDKSGDAREISTSETDTRQKVSLQRKTRPFHRGDRVAFLPAYTMNSIIYSEASEGITDLAVFESFLRIDAPGYPTRCGLSSSNTASAY